LIFLNFSATKANGNANLQWQATNNKEAADYTVEYSLNGNAFSPAGIIAANNEPDLLLIHLLMLLINAMSR